MFSLIIVNDYSLSAVNLQLFWLNLIFIGVIALKLPLINVVSFTLFEFNHGSESVLIDRLLVTEEMNEFARLAGSNIFQSLISESYCHRWHGLICSCMRFVGD